MEVGQTDQTQTAMQVMMMRKVMDLAVERNKTLLEPAMKPTSLPSSPGAGQVLNLLA